MNKILLSMIVLPLVLGACTPVPTATPPPTAAPTAAPAGAVSPFGQSTPDAIPPQILRYALAPLFEPADAQAGCPPALGALLNTVYETLVYLNNDYLFEPSLAESWTASSDALIYTFKLRAGVRFHDGTPFTAAAVRHDFERIAALDRGVAASGARLLLPGYLSAEEVDRYTIRLRFDRPVPALLYTLAGGCLAMLSPASSDQSARSPSELPAGTGPFSVAAELSEAGRTLVLLRNEGYYWGPPAYRTPAAFYSGGSGEDHSGPCRRGSWAREHTGPAFLAKVILQFMADPAERAAALEDAQIDAADDLRPADAARLQASGRFRVYAVPRSTGGEVTAQTALSARLRRLDASLLTAGDVLATPGPPTVYLIVARREVNCLSFGVQAATPYFFDTSIRAIP